MDIDPEKRTGLLEQAALAGEETINGLTLRPMTAATWSLHQRVKRAAGEQDGEDWSFNIFSFVFINSQPVAKLRACYAAPGALLADIFDFMAERQPADATGTAPGYIARCGRTDGSGAAVAAVAAIAGDRPTAAARAAAAARDGSAPCGHSTGVTAITSVANQATVTTGTTYAGRTGLAVKPIATVASVATAGRIESIGSRRAAGRASGSDAS